LRRLEETALSLLEALEKTPWERAVWSFVGAVYLRNLLEMALEAPHTLRFPLWDALVQYPAFYLVVDLGFAWILRWAGYARDSLQILKVLFFAQWIVLVTPLVDGLVAGPSFPAYFRDPAEVLTKSLSVFVFWVHTPPLTAGMKTQILLALGAIWVWGGLRGVGWFRRLFALYGLFLWMIFTGSPPAYLYPPSLPWVFTQKEQITTAFFLIFLILSALGYGKAWSVLRSSPPWWALLGFGVGALEIRFFPWQSVLAGGLLFLLWAWAGWHLEEDRPLPAALAVLGGVATFYKAVPLVLAAGVGVWGAGRRGVIPGILYRAPVRWMAFLSGLALWRGHYLFLDHPLIILGSFGLAIFQEIFPAAFRLLPAVLLAAGLLHRAPELEALHRFYTGDPVDSTLTKVLAALPDGLAIDEPWMRLALADALHSRCRFEEARQLLLHHPEETSRQWGRFLSLWGQDTTLGETFPGAYPSAENALPVVELLYRFAFQNPREGLAWFERMTQLGALSPRSPLGPLVDFLLLRANPALASAYPLPEKAPEPFQWVAAYALILRGDTLGIKALLEWYQNTPPGVYHPFVATLLDSLVGPDPERWTILAPDCPVPWVVIRHAGPVCPCEAGS